MRKNTAYRINNRYVNIGDLDRHFHGNMENVCAYIQQNYLVERDVALYYINLYNQDKPFKKKCSVLSILAFCFCLSLFMRIPNGLALICAITSLILAIIDLATKSAERIPKHHFLSIIAIILSVISIHSLISSFKTIYNDNVSNSSVEKEADTNYQKAEANVGEGITYGDVTINLTDFYEYTNYDYASPSAEHKVVAFDLQIINNSDESFYFSNFYASGYADNVKVDEFFTDSDTDFELAPGRTGNVTIAYEVPINAQGIEMDYVFNQFTDETGVFIGR